MGLNTKQFYSCQKDFEQFYHNLKLTHCPNCQEVGYLILNGILYGNDEKICTKTILRGHRIFCSNRNQRKGCGKTFSILDSGILKRFTISTRSFWLFLINIFNGMNPVPAFKTLKLSFSTTTIYRLIKTFSNAQSHLRTLLSQRCKPPSLKLNSSSLYETIHHLKYAFKNTPFNPITAFQLTFQKTFI